MTQASAPCCPFGRQKVINAEAGVFGIASGFALFLRGAVTLKDKHLEPSVWFIQNKGDLIEKGQEGCGCGGG